MLASTKIPCRRYRKVLPVLLLGQYNIGVLAQESAIPYKSSGGDDPASQFLDVLLIIGVLMAAAALMVALYRRRLVKDGSIPEERGGYLKVLDRKVLSTRLTAHLISVEGQKILICDSGQGVAIKDLSTDRIEEPLEV